MNEIQEYYSDVPMHHGILGQKWGVRRYQNEDGSLTKAGQGRHYTTGSASKTKKAIATYKDSEANTQRRKEAYAKVKSSKGTTKHDLKVAKNAYGQAKNKEKRDYKKIKQAHYADQGRELYKEGKRITYSRSEPLAKIMKASMNSAMVTASVNIGTSFLAMNGYTNAYLNALGNISYYASIGSAIVGSGAGAAIVARNVHSDLNGTNKRLRAYYNG